MLCLNELTIDLNNACYLRCIHCSNPSTPHNPHIKVPIVLQTLYEFAQLGGRIVNLAGGEPLLYKGLYKIIKTSTELGVISNLYTSGVWWRQGDSHVDTLIKAKQLADVGLSSAYLSFHGANDPIHDRITGRSGSFYHLISLSYALRVVNVDVYMHFVPMRPNFSELEAVCQLAWDLDLKGIRFLRFVPQGRGNTNNDFLSLDSSQMIDLITKLENIVYEAPPEKIITFGGFPEYFPCRTYKVDGMGCQAGKKFLHITAEGNIVPCPAYKKHPRAVLATLKHGSLRDAIGSLKLQMLKEEYVALSDTKWLCPAHR